MKVRLVRAPKFNPFTIPGLLFAAEGDAAAGATTDTSTADQTSAGDADTKDEPDPKGADALGDKGKKALDEMKSKWTSERDARKKLETDIAAMTAKAEGKEAEHAAAQESQRVQDAALAVANVRILKAEVRAAAAGKLTDPADALQFLDLSALEVGADGEVDGDAIAAAIADLISKKPYLAAQGGKRFTGEADGGTRNESEKSIDDQIAEASKAGNHALAITLKRQKAYAEKS